MLGTIILIVVLMIFAFTMGVLIYANLKLRQKIENFKEIIGTPVPFRHYYTRADKTTIFERIDTLQDHIEAFWRRMNNVQDRTNALWVDRYGAESNRDDATVNEAHIHAED